jgi:hypothetical protein
MSIGKTGKVRAGVAVPNKRFGLMGRKVSRQPNCKATSGLSMEKIRNNQALGNGLARNARCCK